MAFNWVDLVILLLLGGAGYVSSRIGLLRLAGTIAGFFAGLFFAGWLFPHLIPIKDPTLLLIVNSNLVLLFSAYCGFRALDFGHYLKKSIKHQKHHTTEEALGMGFGVIAMFVLVWLLSVAVVRMPFAGLSNSVNDSFTIQQLDMIMPPVPAVFANLGRLVDPNSPPRVYRGHQPRPELVTPTIPPSLVEAANSTEDSIVRITGFGCGGIYSGSGFSVGPNLFVTNAHVVAGIQRPIIKTPNKSVEGRVVLFNPIKDVAVLKTEGLNIMPLSLSRNLLTNKSPVALIGYPDGNFTIMAGSIGDFEAILVSSIYGTGTYERKAYYIQSHVAEGGSGGPVISEDGKVAAMIFARIEDGSKGGYAITADELVPLVEQATRVNRKVNTGACLGS